MNFETISLIVFVALLIIFVVLKRKDIHTEKILFPIFYLLLYRTKTGIRQMNSLAAKHPKTLRVLGFIGIVVGFAGMAFLCVTLIYHLFNFFITPSAPALALVLPFKLKGAFYIPFFYWIISIIILAFIHEFSHGVMAVLAKVRIKSSGFAFMSILLPIIPAAFVEPDEKQLAKKKRSEQLAVMAAGPFSNILLGFILLGLMFIFSFPITNSMYDFRGAEIVDFMNINNVTSPLELAGLHKGDVITTVNGVPVNHVKDLSELLKNMTPGQKTALTTQNATYDLVLAANPTNSSKTYLGIYINQNFQEKPKFMYGLANIFAKIVSWINGKWISKDMPAESGLISWLMLLNIGIGLFNLIPIGPIDGGKMLFLALTRFFEKKKALKIFGAISSLFLLIILFNLIAGFIF